MSPATSKDWQFVHLLWKWQCSCTELWYLKFTRMAAHGRDFLSQLNFTCHPGCCHLDRYLQPQPCPHLRICAEQTGAHDGPRPDANGGADSIGTEWYKYILMHMIDSKPALYQENTIISMMYGNVRISKMTTPWDQKVLKKTIPRPDRATCLLLALTLLLMANQMASVSSCCRISLSLIPV